MAKKPKETAPEVRFTVTQNQKRKLMHAARAKGLTLGAYVRMRLIEIDGLEVGGRDLEHTPA